MTFELLVHLLCCMTMKTYIRRSWLATWRLPDHDSTTQTPTSLRHCDNNTNSSWMPRS